jgi:hypothetical protein
MTKRELNPIQATQEIECLVLDARQIKSDIKKMEGVLKKIEASICAFMKGKEDLIDEDGTVIVTWAHTAPTKRFDTKRFKE